MTTKQKIWLVSFLCFGIGVGVLAVGVRIGGRPGFYIDSNGVHVAGEKIKNEAVRGKERLDAFDSVEISTRDADVEIISSDKDEYRVEYCTDGNSKKPVCEVKNGKFIFRDGDTKGTWNFMVFSVGSRMEGDYYIKLYVPKNAEFSSVTVKNEDGSIVIPGLRSGQLNLETEYGDVDIRKFQGDALKIEIQDGDLKTGKIASEKIDIESEYGNVEMEQAEGKMLRAELEDGDFRAGVLEFSEVDIQAEYGDVYAGITGDVKAYDWNLKTEYGGIKVAGNSIASGGDEISYKKDNGTGKKVKIICEDGNIEVAEHKDQ